jgi:hypothetical protein
MVALYLRAILVTEDLCLAGQPPPRRHLTEAGLAPRALAREMNRLFGPGTVAETAPYYWRDAGGLPRDPLPALAAYVMSRHLGRVVTVGDLWQRPCVPSTRHRLPHPSSSTAPESAPANSYLTRA